MLKIQDKDTVLYLEDKDASFKIVTQIKLLKNDAFKETSELVDNTRTCSRKRQPPTITIGFIIIIVIIIIIIMIIMRLRSRNRPSA